MSTMTKVFAVLLVVFSIAFTVMTVSIVAQTADWKETALRYRQHAQVADTNLRNQIAASAAELATANDTIQQHLETIADLEVDVKEKDEEVGELQLQIARAEAEKSNAQAINRGLLAQLENSEKTKAQYRQQRDDLEHTHIDLTRRNIDLNDRVNELTAQIVVMMEQKRQFEQQINILKGENEKLARATHAVSVGGLLEEPAGAAMARVVAASPVSATAIRGKVIDVLGDVITVSVGSTDNVKEGMIFVVHRNDRYLGDLKITLVDPDQSAGRAMGRSFSVQPGDSVTDAVAMSSSRG